MLSLTDFIKLATITTTWLMLENDGGHGLKKNNRSSMLKSDILLSHSFTQPPPYTDFVA